MRAVLRGLDRVLALLLLAAVALYRAVVAPLLGGACRFSPSCSAYAREALRRHGGVEGVRLTARRLARCRPRGGGGEDPVPG